jgi:hypothetical protein
VVVAQEAFFGGEGALEGLDGWGECALAKAIEGGEVEDVGGLGGVVVGGVVVGEGVGVREEGPA